MSAECHKCGRDLDYGFAGAPPSCAYCALRAELERVKAGVRHLQKRYERRERLHTSDFTALIVAPQNDATPAETGATLNTSDAVNEGKPIG